MANNDELKNIIYMSIDTQREKLRNINERIENLKAELEKKNDSKNQIDTESLIELSEIKTLKNYNMNPKYIEKFLIQNPQKTIIYNNKPTNDFFEFYLTKCNDNEFYLLLEHISKFTEAQQKEIEPRIDQNFKEEYKGEKNGNEALKHIILESINQKLKELDKVNLRIAELEKEIEEKKKNNIYFPIDGEYNNWKIYIKELKSEKIRLERKNQKLKEKHNKLSIRFEELNQLHKIIIKDLRFYKKLTKEKFGKEIPALITHLSSEDYLNKREIIFKALDNKPKLTLQDLFIIIHKQYDWSKTSISRYYYEWIDIQNKIFEQKLKEVNKNE